MKLSSTLNFYLLLSKCLTFPKWTPLVIEKLLKISPMTFVKWCFCSSNGKTICMKSLSIFTQSKGVQFCLCKIDSENWPYTPHAFWSSISIRIWRKWCPCQTINYLRPLFWELVFLLWLVNYMKVLFTQDLFVFTLITGKLANSRL